LQGCTLVVALNVYAIMWSGNLRCRDVWSSYHPWNLTKICLCFQIRRGLDSRTKKNNIRRLNSITKKHWLNQFYVPSTFFVNVVMMMHSFVVPYAFCTIFIFENYPVDIGNNNYMTMLVKVKMWYNVTNFTNHFPTSRFCNGRIQRHHELSQWWNS